VRETEKQNAGGITARLFYACIFKTAFI